MNMVVNYNVYKRNADEVPIISMSALPKIQMKGKKKFAGKKAKIEAILRLTGEVLPETWTTKQVNDFVGVNLFGTSKWNEYHSILNEVLDERIAIPDRYVFQYSLAVTFSDEMTVGKRTGKTDPIDERVIYLVTRELMGAPLEMYKSVINPIKAIRKNNSNEAKNY